MLNKQSRKADNEWSDSFVFGRGDKNSSHKTGFFVPHRIISVVKTVQFVSDFFHVGL
jgi:hypothetical protein